MNQVLPKTIFKIRPDNGENVTAKDIPEFKAKMAKDIVFDAENDHHDFWPVIHPGPEDSWAGNRLYKYDLKFNWNGAQDGLILLKVRLHGNNFDSTVSHSGTQDIVMHLNAKFLVYINGREWPWENHWGRYFSHLYMDWGHNFTAQNVWWGTLPADVLRQGENTITFTVAKGEGLNYKEIELVHFQSGINIEDVESTVFYKRINGILHNRVMATVVQPSSKSVPITMNLFSNHDSYQQEANLGFGRHTIEFYIPDTENDPTILLDVHFGDETISFQKKLKMRRKWGICLNHHTHTDLGYTHLPTEIKDRQIENMRTALGFCGRTENWPSESRFVWTVEVSWLLEIFLKQASIDEKDRIEKYIRNGQLKVQGLYLNVHTDLLNSEEMIELLTFKRMGMKAKSAMSTDVPGITWPMVEVMSQAGIQYFDLTPNFIMAPRSPQITTPQVFYWVSPGRKKKILTWYNIYHYFDGNELGFTTNIDVAEVNVCNRLKELERKGFPYSYYLVRIGGYFIDNSKPNFKIAEVIKKWNEKWEYPKVYMGDASSLLGDLEKDAKDNIPEVYGDLADWWVDGVGSGIKEVSAGREIQNQLPQLRTKGSLLELITKKKHSKEGINRAYHNQLLFDEHTWGFWDAHPGQELHHQSIEQKKSYLNKASEIAKQINEEQWKTIQSSFNHNELILFNPLNWERHELVKVALSENHDHPVIIDPESGQLLDCQVVVRPNGERELWFYPELPSLGFKSYQVSRSPENKTFLQKASYENRFFQYEMNKTTGAIDRLTDKRNGKQWVNPDPVGLGQYMRSEMQRGDWGPWESLIPNQKTTPNILQSCKLVSHVSGPIANIVRIEGTDTCSNQIIVEYIFSNREPIIDVSVKINKIDTDVYEQGFLAFPFNIENARVKYDLALGTVEFPSQLLPGSALDHQAVHSWVDFSTESHGVMVVTKDSPLVQIGRIRTGEFQAVEGIYGHSEPPVANLPATLVSLIYNNRWGTNFWPTQKGEISLNYRIIPYCGGLSVAEKNKLASNVLSPIEGGFGSKDKNNDNPRAEAFLNSFLNINGNVKLESFEVVSEKEVYIRFREISGISHQVTLKLLFPLKHVIQLNLEHLEEKPLKMNGDDFVFFAEAFSLVQVKAILK